MYHLSFTPLRNHFISTELPTSKSISNRALVLNKLLNNKVFLTNLSEADDTQLMLFALNSESSEINLNNAGTCMRFLSAYFASQANREVLLLCNERMKQRPIAELVNILIDLGAKIDFIEKEAFPPLKISGSLLIGKNIEIDASESSQYITALMLIAPFIQNGLNITLKGKVASFDYINMTALLMESWGFEIKWSTNNIEIKQLHQSIHMADYAIEKDWSSAAFWYLIVVLHFDMKVCLIGLSLNSIQGDNVTAEIFEKLGVKSNETDEGLIIYKHKAPETNLHFDLLSCIDLAPALSVACAALNVKATITGLQNLVIKESNRLLALVQELCKLGYHIEYNTTSIFIHPIDRVDYKKHVLINTYNDHRLVMAFAPMALLFSNIALDDISAVSKSYPTFFSELKKAGIVIQGASTNLQFHK